MGKLGLLKKPKSENLFKEKGLGWLFSQLKQQWAERWGYMRREHVV